jgi:hypothetical protein
MAAKWLGFAPALVFAIAAPLAAHPNGNDAVAKQASTAAAHAGMALGAADLKMAHAHLQHVVNCLVGPSGEGYDAQQADPCKGMGQGALVDARGDAARESQLQAALAQARQGVKATTVDEAHADAQKAMNSLQAH